MLYQGSPENTHGLAMFSFVRVESEEGIGALFNTRPYGYYSPNSIKPAYPDIG